MAIASGSPTNIPGDIRHHFGANFGPDTLSGQWWQLVTYMCLHGGVWHIVFNMWWLTDLGALAERQLRSFWFLLLVLAIAITSNGAQYWAHGSAFGGMSGVVYGLAGYVWIRGKLDRGSGLYLDSQNIVYLLVWLVVCFTGMVGPVANIAHLVGLLSGMSCGWITAQFRSRKPDQ